MREDHTEPSRGVIPMVFCGAEPTLMIVTEVPPKGRWEAGKGGSWQDGNLFHNDNGGIQRTFCEWFDIDEQSFQKKVFWIDLMNCWIAKENRKEPKPGISCSDRSLYQYCAGKYIDRCIMAVEPKLIITLGKPAAAFFVGSNVVRQRGLKEFIGVGKTPHVTTLNGKTHCCGLAHLYHPSRRNDYSGRNNSSEQKACVDELSQIIKNYVDMRETKRA